MLSVPHYLLTRWFSLPALGALTLLLGACDANSQACESSVDCYVGESCVLGTCVLDEEPDLDAGPDTPDEDADDTDTPDEDAGDTDQSDADTDTETDTDTDVIDEPPHPIAISAAMNFSCTILSDRTVWCWGDNSAGFITGADDEALTPRKIDGFDGAVEIATANARICVRTEEGAVLCRGDGALGSGAALVTKIDEGATQLNAGGYHMCATVGADAALYCWGDNGFEQIGGNNDDPTIVPAPIAGASNINLFAGGDFHTCMATTSDEVRCLGHNIDLQLGVEGGQSGELITHPFFSASTNPVFELVAGGSHNCVLSESAEVWCWGDNSFGQLATELTSLETSAQPVMIDLSDALSDLAAGFERTCGIGTGGKVFCWGRDEYDQLQHVHEIPDLEGVDELAIGQRHTCALTRDHAIFCWGKNHLGQLGNGSLTDLEVPLDPVEAPWAQ
ncbi:RCC1 domain-containing protein [Lujinxingia vulgaris]|nr:hypothetical protein [Lujinxingia vulgaris]